MADPRDAEQVPDTFPGHDLELVTEHLLLRPCELADFDVALTYYLDPEIRALMDHNPEYEVTREWIQAVGREMAMQGYLFTIVLGASGRAIGEACLQWMNLERAGVRPDEKVMRLPIGIWDKSLWRRGYGREAAETLMEHAFRVEGVDRFCAMGVAPENERSVGLFTSLGLRVVRELPDQNEIDLEITREDYLRDPTA